MKACRLVKVGIVVTTTWERASMEKINEQQISAVVADQGDGRGRGVQL